jgi:uncharacterized protein (TIGR03546 family)
LGLVLGLLPKGNLLAVSVSLLILGTRVNLPAAMLSALAFSLVGVHLDSLTHPFGWVLLRHETLQPAWTFLYRLPLVPWTSFNNTVVLGSFTLGLTLFYPTYVLSHAVFQRWQSIRTRGRSRNGSAECGRSGSPDSAASSPGGVGRDGAVEVEVRSPTLLQADPVTTNWDDPIVEHRVGSVFDANPPLACTFRFADRSRSLSSAASREDSSASGEEPTSLPPARRSA